MASAKKAVSRVAVVEAGTAPAVAAAAVLEKAVVVEASSLTGEDWNRWFGKLLSTDTGISTERNGVKHFIPAGAEFKVMSHIPSWDKGRRGHIEYLDVASGLQNYADLDLIQAGQTFTYIEGREYKERPLDLRRLMQACRDRTVRGSMGSDPEIFAVNAKGELIPAFEFLGPKDPSFRHVVGPGSTSAHAYWDGYQAEFSHAPFTCINYVTDYIRNGLDLTYRALKKKDKDANLSLRSTFEIPPERLVNDDPKYVAFGCMPSLSAYNEKPKKFDPYLIPFRTAGGHLHFAFTGDIPEAVKALDRILGVISVSMYQYWENPQRRLLYGRAGEYRKTGYGFEYRVLSNSWLCHPSMVHFVYELARRCFGMSRTGPWQQWDVTEEEARECINNSDVKLAQKLLARNDLALSGLLAGLPGGGLNADDTLLETTATLKDMVLNGVHKYLRNPDYLSSAWGLGLPLHATSANPGDTGYYLYSSGKAGRLSTGVAYATKNKMLD